LLASHWASTCYLEINHKSNKISIYSYRYVKPNNPYVNVMIVIGAVILYVTVILFKFSVDENIASDSIVNGLCQTRVWLCDWI